MALAPFFSRAYSALGSHLGITRAELEESLSGHVVGIYAGTACSAEGNEKWIAELLVNLLARLYPVIAISGHDAACENIARIANAINPDIEIKGDTEEAGITVHVGGIAKSNKSFNAGARGWVAYVGTNEQGNITGPINPYSSGVAAALAAWRVFQSIFARDTVALPDISLSLLDYSSHSGAEDVLPSIDIGEVAVAGIGAVGNPAIWAWAKHSGLTGELHLIDPEDIELSNLQRYCLPFHGDVGMGKGELAARELLNSKLSHRLWPCSLQDFANTYEGIEKLPSICVSVDNVDGRRTAQALLPRLVVNGWTSDNGLGASWHRFMDNSACLACLYQPKNASLSQTELAAQALGLPHDRLAALWVSEKPIESDVIAIAETHLGLSSGKLADWKGKRVQDIYSGVICGQIGLDLAGIGRVATVPLAHQSVLAGLLMAAELVKRSEPGIEARSQDEPLIIWDDIMRTPPKYWTAMRAKERECFCNDEVYRKIYLEKWDKS